MATEFIMPRLPDHQPHQRFFSYHSQPQSRSTSPTYAAAQIMAAQQSHQVSPMSSSTNGSPTASSPISHHNQRRPLYIPAVLRPNEYPSKSKKAQDPDQSSLQSNNSSLLNSGGWGALGRLTRRSTGDSGKAFNDEDDCCSWAQWQLDLFAKPSAQPTRQHWKVSLIRPWDHWPPALEQPY